MSPHALADARVQRRCLAVGVAAGAIVAVASVHAPAQFFAAWLWAWLCVLAVALGALVNVMIHELTGGDWGVVLRPALESALATLPTVALLGVPLLFGAADLYPWAAHSADATLDGRRWYLNAPFVVARAAIDFAVWIALAAALRRRWRRARSDADGAATPAVRALCIAGLLLYALTMTLAAVDWIMALSAQWYSTGFGLLVMVTQASAAFSFAVVVSAATGAMAGARAIDDDRNAALVERPNPARDAQDLGNILLTYAMLWAYLAFMQFLIIWAEDLPDEISWYVTRSSPTWKTLAIIVFALQFALPFAAMLFRSFKRNPARLGALCAIAFLATLLGIAWQVLPPVPGMTAWRALLALTAVGALWLRAFMGAYARDLPLRRQTRALATPHG